jgi:Tol biopolymer transport system component
MHIPHRGLGLVSAPLLLALALTGLPALSATASAPSAAAQLAPAPDTRLVSGGLNGQPANGPGDRPDISKDGRYVVFDSTASNLVAGVPFKTRRVYRKDLVTGVTEMVSVGNSGNFAAAWSSFGHPNADGNLVAFVSDDKTLVPGGTGPRAVFLRNFSTSPATTELISVNSAEVRADRAASRPSISPDGRFVTFNSPATNLSPLGGNGFEQVYLRDRLLGTTTLVSVTPTGGLANGVTYRGIVNGDGRYVAFSSKGNNLVNDGGAATEAVYLRDMQTGQTIRVSKRANGAPSGGARPYVSPDGQQVVYNTHAAGVASDTNGFSDVYVYDRLTNTRTRASVTPTGGNGTNDSLRGFVTDDHGWVAFNSFAQNLATNDNKSVGDCFLHDTASGQNITVSLSFTGGPANAMSYRPVPDGDGSVVVYQSSARNLVAGDPSTGEQIYVVSTATLLPQ